MIDQNRVAQKRENERRSDGREGGGCSCLLRLLTIQYARLTNIAVGYVYYLYGYIWLG